MLFLLNSRGEPFKARWVQLGATGHKGSRKRARKGSKR
jgi:hypothetical protein